MPSWAVEGNGHLGRVKAEPGVQHFHSLTCDNPTDAQQ